MNTIPDMLSIQGHEQESGLPDIEVAEASYGVLASCMTPGGAWSRSLWHGNSVSEALSIFERAGFERPEMGTAWGLTLSLTCITVNSSGRVCRSVIAERRHD